MYAGRIVAVARAADGRAVALYRVSSRSFPNRTAKVLAGSVAVLPKPGHENIVRENPYVSYNCVRMAGNYCIATNGSQTDPITEKIASGMHARDALAYSLLALDYEKDSYNTPRIAAVIALGAETGFLGIARHDAILVKELAVEPGQAFWVSTYETNEVTVEQVSPFDAADAAAGAQFAVTGGKFAEMTNAVTSVCAMKKAASSNWPRSTSNRKTDAAKINRRPKGNASRRSPFLSDNRIQKKSPLRAEGGFLRFSLRCVAYSTCTRTLPSMSWAAPSAVSVPALAERTVNVPLSARKP